MDEIPNAGILVYVGERWVQPGAGLHSGTGETIIHMGDDQPPVDQGWVKASVYVELLLDQDNDLIEAAGKG